MKKLLLSLFVAATLWFIMFSPWTASLVNFWCMMAFSAMILTLLAYFMGGLRLAQLRFDLRELIMGLLIAVVLWGVFWLGDKLSQQMFSFARPQVDLIYGMKEGQNSWLLSATLLFLIGPAEELFWRYYVQRQFCGFCSPNVAYLTATFVYAAVHLPSFNFMLIMSALVCGLVWGGLFRIMPRHFPAIMLSHALWDAAVFVWFPI